MEPGGAGPHVLSKTRAFLNQMWFGPAASSWQNPSSALGPPAYLFGAVGTEGGCSSLPATHREGSGPTILCRSQGCCHGSPPVLFPQDAPS